jgi:hypothetical protein
MKSYHDHLGIPDLSAQTRTSIYRLEEWKLGDDGSRLAYLQDSIIRKYYLEPGANEWGNINVREAIQKYFIHVIKNGSRFSLHMIPKLKIA